ncbi:hypothetical protein DNTS_021729 [Danionella cerebrum]|uniref:Transcription factor CBF/NF-Y/archaeal histone domain-containing protein n=1 Tax=Danionella cerebrum TaxID=2873325 RepID=A0A553NJA9_9TELE|nr:hypothetical protein DNTS_021729 [Danionella translucida]
MPSKKKKYNARFPPLVGHIWSGIKAGERNIFSEMITTGAKSCLIGDHPASDSRALELFLESLLTKACHVTQSRNAKTMTTSHLKQCIELEQQFDFLKDLVASVPDMQGDGEENHTEGEKIPRRGRKPGSSRKNGGAGAKGKEKKLSGTESEQEDDSEDTETEGEDDEEASRTSSIQPPAPYYHSMQAAAQFTPMASHPPPPVSLMGLVAPAANTNQKDDEDEDYDS